MPTGTPPDPAEIRVMDRAYGRHPDGRAMPARTTTTRTDRLYGGSRVEITCMAWHR